MGYPAVEFLKERNWWLKGANLHDQGLQIHESPL